LRPIRSACSPSATCQDWRRFFKPERFQVPSLMVVQALAGAHVSTSIISDWNMNLRRDVLNVHRESPTGLDLVETIWETATPSRPPQTGTLRSILPSWPALPSSFPPRASALAMGFAPIPFANAVTLRGSVQVTLCLLPSQPVKSTAPLSWRCTLWPPLHASRPAWSIHFGVARFVRGTSGGRFRFVLRSAWAWLAT
jgi:hypothetical protein